MSPSDPPSNQVEDRKSTLVTDDRLAVDDAGAGRECGDRRDRRRKAVSQIVAVAAQEPDASALTVRQDPEAIVLDLVNPTGSGRRMLCDTRQARLKRGRGLLGAQPAPQLTRY